MNILLTCTTCDNVWDIPATHLDLADLTGWHAIWECPGSECRAPVATRLPKGQPTKLRDAGSHVIPDGPDLDAMRARHLTEFTEDEYLEAAYAIHTNRLGHFTALVARRQEVLHV